jgi:hypothetical protein
MPIIYDISSCAYRNDEKKDLIWEEIASEISCDGKCLFIMRRLIKPLQFVGE